MNFSNSDKQAIINEQARIFTKVTILSTGDTFTEDTSLASWEYEDFRYVPNQGFIGQFVERLMDVVLKGVQITTTLVDQEINVQIGVDNKIDNTLTYYDMGNFVVTKVGDTDTTGNVTIESADYTKKFNVVYDANDSKFPILAGHLANNICNYVGVELATTGNAAYYIHNSDTALPIGTYSIRTNNKLYTFATTKALNKYDVLLVNMLTDKVIQKTVDSETHAVTRVELTPSESEVEYLDGYDRIIDNTSGKKKVTNVEIYGRTVQADGDLSDISTISGNLTLSIGSNNVTIALGTTELCSMPDNILYNTQNIFYNDVDNDADLVIYDNYARDILKIDGINGTVTKIAYIGKIDSYDGEEISAPFISSTGTLSTGATVYYLLDEPVITQLSSITFPATPTGNITITNNKDAEMKIEIATYPDSSYSLGTAIEGEITPWVDFTNNDFVISEWPYNALDTARKAMADIGKLAYSWVRTGEDNKVHIDFTQKSQGDIDEYDTITIDDYYDLTTEPKYIGPINRVSLGSEDIDGDEIYKDAPNISGEIHELEISDNAFTNTDELRKIALDGCERLFGLTYIPLEMNTIGHPWLKGDELIRVQNLGDDFVYTYPFDRTLSYKGFIKSRIASSGKNKIQTAYEFKSDTLAAIRDAEIKVDKSAGQIQLLTSEVYPNGVGSESAIQLNADAIELKVDSDVYDANNAEIDKKFAGTTSTALSQRIAGAESTMVLKAKADGSLVTAELKANASTGSAFTVKADDVDLSGKEIKLTADNIKITSTNFNVDKNGNMTCNDATINGNLVTANGVLTNLIFPCENWGWTIENAYEGVGGWFLGFNYLFNSSYAPYSIKSFLNFCINIPANFTVTSARIYLRHTPTKWTTGAGEFSTTQQYYVGDYCVRSGYVYRCTTNHKGNWNASHFSQYAAEQITGYCRNVKVYEATNLGQTAEGAYYSEYTIGGTAPTLTQITTDDLTFNSSSFEQKATSNFSSIFTTSTSPQTHNVVVWTDITNPSITAIDTAYKEIGQYTGIVTGYAQIIGYLKTT